MDISSSRNPFENPVKAGSRGAETRTGVGALGPRTSSASGLTLVGDLSSSSPGSDDHSLGSVTSHENWHLRLYCEAHWEVLVCSRCLVLLLP